MEIPGAIVAQEFQIQRKLTAVFAADVEGFSRLMSADEDGTLRELASQRRILDAAIAKYRGRIANTAGDSVLAEFPSVSDAVQCAVGVQRELKENAAPLPADKRVQFRIGIHLGDVTPNGSDLLGNGVNIASRLQSIADANGLVISSTAYEQVRKTLPLQFVDLGEQRLKGLDDTIRAFALTNSADQTRAPASLPERGKSLPLPDKPSIAVLPFQNMSGDPEQEYFADGMVEDITTALSRFKSLFVIARNSSFTYKGKAVDIKQVGRELGVRYVLEGSVRRAGNRVRITGQLIEASTNNHLWADRFDGALEDVFDLQDQVTEKVVGAIVPRLDQVGIESIRHKPPENWHSYDHYLRGRMLLDQFTPEAMDEAEAEFHKAVALDPNFALGHAFAGALSSAPASKTSDCRGTGGGSLLSRSCSPACARRRVCPLNCMDGHCKCGRPVRARLCAGTPGSRA
jgi:adenylate cyclase